MGHDGTMTPRSLRAAALSVHLLTATGAIFAMLAMLAAVQEQWQTMFLWLVVAFVVDGIDGPLARKTDVQTNAPEFDGVLMDLIIDYLTYVFIPAYALFSTDLLPGWTGWVAILVITYASVVYFADTRMKTADKSFSGFPGCWNMVVIVFFALSPPPMVILPVVVVLAVLMFLPVKFVHPVRTKRWRVITLPAAAVWVVSATVAAVTGFSLSGWVEWALIATSVWLMGAGALQQVIPERRAR
jgi:phosphatidylcholine synthase